MADPKILKGFQVMLKNYFFNLPEVQQKYIVPDSKAMMNMQLTDFQKKSLSVAKAARERAFIRYYNRIVSQTVINAETGEPYKADDPEKMNKIAYDFYLGKKIALPGAGQDNFISIKTTGNNYYRKYITMDCHDAKNIPSYIDVSEKDSKFDYGLDIDTKFNLSAEEKFKTLPTDVPKPTGGGWWNKICKAILGRPSARWQKYEDFQKVQSFNGLVDIQKQSQDARLELNDSLVEKDYEEVKRHPDEYGKRFDIKELQDKKPEEYENKEINSDSLKTSFGYDEKSKQWVNSGKLEREQARKEAEINKAKKEAEINEAKIEEEPVQEKKEPAKKAPEKPVDPAVLIFQESRKNKTVVEFDNMFEGNKPGTLPSDKRVDASMYKRSMQNLFAYSMAKESNPEKYSIEKFAEDLTNVYYAHTLHENVDDMAPSSMGENETTYGVLVSDNQIGYNGRKIFKQIKNELVNADFVKEYFEHPEKLKEDLFKDSPEPLKENVGKLAEKINTPKVEDLIQDKIKANVKENDAKLASL